MQTIWSRIAQAGGGCRCPQCLHAVHGVSRRAAASATRQAPRYIKSSTLWYSGIFAAAATFDSAGKIKRTEQWDQAIASVNQEAGLGRADELHDGLEQQQAQQQSERNDTVSGVEALIEASNVFDDVRPRRRRARWPTNTGPPLNVGQLPPQSIYATEVREQRAEVSRRSPKKLETAMVSADLLQLQLLLELQDQPWSREACSEVPIEYWHKIARIDNRLHVVIRQKQGVLKTLVGCDPQLTDYSRPNYDISLSDYREDDQGHFHDAARYLNASLQSLFMRHSNQTMPTGDLLAMLAYSLSASPAPPNLSVFNTLLLGLSKAQQPNAVYNTIRCLRNTHIRPNEVTNAAVLRHYTAQDDASGFVYWIELMRGKHNGQALARPDICINDDNRSRLVPKIDAPHKIIQLPYPTPNVFGAILEGVLKFGGFDSALTICRNMGQEGWGLCMSGLTPLLRDCADRCDWTAGEAVWQQIQALRAKSRRFLVHGGATYEKIKLETYATMLRLCSQCKRQEAFDGILEQAYDAHQHLRERLPEIIRQQSRDSKARAAAHAHGFDDEAHESRVVAAPRLQGAIQFDEVSPRNHQKDAAEVATLRDPILEQNELGDDDRQHQHHHEHESSEASETHDLRGTQWKLLQEQFEALRPPSHELDDWELRQRPTSLTSRTLEPSAESIAGRRGKVKVVPSWHPALEVRREVHVDS